MKNLFLLVILFSSLTAQDNELSLPIYRIEIDSVFLQILNENPWTDEYFPALFIYGTNQYNCEVRYRGRTSRNLPKKSWRVKFEDDSNIFGLDKINLNAEFRDRSLMRNHLSMSLFHFLGYPAPLTNFVSLYVNEDYYGVFVNVEEVDAKFYQRNDRVARTLYKGKDHGASMAPLVNHQLYFDSWEKKIGDPLDYADIQLLFSKLLYWSNEDFSSFIQSEVNIDNILNYFAVEFFIVSYDCFTKNIFLSFNPDLDHFEIFPWDNDATFGNDFAGNYRPSFASFYSGSPLDNQILFQRLMEDEEQRDEFWTKVEFIASAGLVFLQDEIENTFADIKNDVYQDTAKICSNLEFDNEILRLQEFLTSRQNFLSGFSYFNRKTLSNFSVSTSNPTIDSAIVQFTINAVEPQDIDVKLLRSLDVNIWGDPFFTTTLQLYDDGLHADGDAGDLLYGNSIRITGTEDIIPYYFKADGFDYPGNGGFYINYIQSHTFALIPTTESQNLEEHLTIGDIYHTNNDYFVEVINASSNALDLSYTRFQSGPYFNNFCFPSNSILSPQDTLIVTTNVSLASTYFTGAQSFGNLFYEIELGDTIKLLSSVLSPIVEKYCTEYTSLGIEFADIVLNEINYNSAEDFDVGDWIEFYNPNDEPVGLSNWYFQDASDSHIFSFPVNTTIDSHGYLILCNDQRAFQSMFSNTVNIAGEMDFGFSGGGELLRLFTPVGTVADSVRYSDELPWPSAADGDGSTLQLIDYRSDNSIAENWGASIGHGTPGTENVDFLALDRESIVQHKLNQNFPNPFNSTTMITYALDTPGLVTLEIFDLTGRKIETLVNANKAGGSYSVRFDAESFSSGIYIYRLRIHNDQVATMKMLLIH